MSDTAYYSIDLTEAEAKGLVRIVMSGGGNFDGDDFTDSLNDAHDAAYRIAALLQDAGVAGLSERTVEYVEARRHWPADKRGAIT